MPDLKILASHPVQYHVPFFHALIAAGLDVQVGYYHQGAAGQVAHDAGFGLDFAWDVDLLGDYSHHIFIKEPANYQLAEQIKIAPGLLRWTMKCRKTPLLLIGWFTEVVWLVWWLRSLRRAPTLVISETTPLAFAASPKSAWRMALLRWLLRQTAASLFIGHHNRAFLTGMGVPDERLFHAPYSIDNTRFADEANQLWSQRRELCIQYGLDPAQPVFLFCGKLIPIKRPLQLLEAYLAAGLQDRAQLLYVGEGMLRPELERRIQTSNLKQVHLLGFLNQSRIPLAYVLGELLCLISESETWGLVVNEALACGRPVIVSDTVGCTPDLVGPENGWVIPVADHDRLAQALLDAFERYPAWPEMGRAGQEKVQGHTFTAMAAGVRSALEAINHNKT